MSGIGKRHRRRGALGGALEAAHARVARLSASPPLAARRSPVADVAARLRAATPTDVREVARPQLHAPAASPEIRAIWLVHAEAALMGGDYGLVEEARAQSQSAVIVACDLFVDPLLLDRARDAGADAVGLVARAMSDTELLTRASEARARGLGVAVECKDAAEVERAAAAGADAILAPVFDRDRARPDADAAAVVRASAFAAGLPALDVLGLAHLGSSSTDASTLDADPEPA